MEIIFQKVSGQPVSEVIQRETSSTRSITDIFGNTILLPNYMGVIEIKEWTGDDFEQMVSLTVG